MPNADIILGVDVGASGIKGAPVDSTKGILVSDRIRLETPNPATPEAVAETFKELVKAFKWKKRIGVGFPSIIKKGTAYSAANIDKNWNGLNVKKFLEKSTELPVRVINDADAAGLAEMNYGHGKDMLGVVLLITIGSGLGSALFLDGKLLPNTEFGHVRMHGMIAEHYASSRIRKELNLDWEEWGKRFDEYLNYMDLLVNPDQIFLGGGISKHFDLFSPFLNVKTKLKPAKLRNNAGIIGAACFAHLD